MLEKSKEVNKFRLLLERVQERIKNSSGLELEIWKSKRNSYEKKLVELEGYNNYDKFGRLR